MKIISSDLHITNKNPVATIQLLVLNSGNKKEKIMTEFLITTGKIHRCYALYVKILNPQKKDMDFSQNYFDIVGHKGFKYVNLMPNDTLKKTIPINFKELFIVRRVPGQHNTNFGTYTITVTLRDLYKNKVPEITSEPLFIDYQKD